MIGDLDDAKDYVLDAAREYHTLVVTKISNPSLREFNKNARKEESARLTLLAATAHLKKMEKKWRGY